ncbi:NAD(P)-dependent oxidoreductase [Streptomyces sp. NPDC051018]|uniref:NAD(P)-dependent oxidoreductase n=1 Tax=Streptomyces sp. NPDC051018 TaxID=3365639 RepID=UPI003797D0C2
MIPSEFTSASVSESFSESPPESPPESVSPSGSDSTADAGSTWSLSLDPIPGTAFVALGDLRDNHRVFDLLCTNFSDVRVAGSREQALDEMTALGPRVCAAIIGVKERIDATVLDALPGLRALGSVGAGTDHLDLDALRERDVQVVTTPGVNAVSVAEHTMMMILGLAKRTLTAHSAVLAGTDRAGMPEPPIELRGRRAGVLGAGATARALLPLLRAFGVDPMFWTRTPDRHPDLSTAPLEVIFRHSDILSIHLPLTNGTRGLVGAELLTLLPEGALVVNTARKEVLDLAGLPAVLSRRPDLRLAVDDFGLAADGTAVALGPTALLSPHTAGVTVESLGAMQDSAVRGTIARLRG